MLGGDEPPEPDYYEILGVAPEASTEDIADAYRREMRRWHPDNNPLSPEAEERTKLIAQAGAILRDPARREAYDEHRRLPPVIVFEPSTVDFGTVRRLDPPKSMTVRLRNDGRPLEADEVLDVPDNGEFWSLVGVTDGDGTDDRVIYEFTLETDVDPDLPPGRYRESARYHLAGSSADLTLAAEVLAEPVRSAVRDSRGSGRAGRGRGSVYWLAVVLGVIGLISGLSSVFSGHQTSPSTTIAPPAEFTPNYPHDPNLVALPDSALDGSLLMANGSVLALGQVISVVDENDNTVWSKIAALPNYVSDPTKPRGPKLSGDCAVLSDGGDKDEIISLTTGQQVVLAGGAVALDGDRAAWSDGTIRNACTGTVLARAAPAGAIRNPECLVGSTVIGSSGPRLTAWRAGRRLWRQPDGSTAVCDAQGSVAIVNSAQNTIALINPRTGRSRWSESDPTCGPDEDVCISDAYGPASMYQYRNVILLTAEDQIAAIAARNGRLLWSKGRGCLLAVRGAPHPGGLIGPCTNDITDFTHHPTATVVNPRTGATISSFSISNEGWTEFTGNSQYVLAAVEASPQAETYTW
jgi:curved DNA-binding protein CbpA